MAIFRGQDSRRLLAHATCQALTALIDMEDAHVPLHVRVQLRNIRSQVERLYRLSDGTDTEVSQLLAEEDGIPLED